MSGGNCFKSKMTASTRAGLSDPVVMELVLQGDMAKILDWLICLPCFINSEWISLSGLFGFHNRSCDNTLRKSFCEISFSVR